MPISRTLSDEPLDPLRMYYRALDSGDLAAAAAMFTDEADYSTPGPSHEGIPTRRSFIGSAGVATWLAVRGVTPVRHQLGDSIHSGPTALVEGHATRADTGATLAAFVVQVTVRDGRLTTFHAFVGDAVQPLTQTAGLPELRVEQRFQAGRHAILLGTTSWHRVKIPFAASLHFTATGQLQSRLILH